MAIAEEKLAKRKGWLMWTENVGEEFAKSRQHNWYVTSTTVRQWDQFHKLKLYRVSFFPTFYEIHVHYERVYDSIFFSSGNTRMLFWLFLFLANIGWYVVIP